jgi:hypothetical protein
MKRDWDTIRDILTKLEDVTPEEGCLRLSSFPPDRAAEISYHVELMMEAGLVNGQMSKTLGSGPHDFLAIRLTWQGHEFLDAIRSDTVWQKTKKSFISGGLSMTFDLVKSVATDIAVAYLKS